MSKSEKNRKNTKNKTNKRPTRKQNMRNKENTNKNNNTKSKKGFWKRHRKLALFLKIMVILIILLIIVVAGAVIAIFNSDNWAMTKEDLTFKSTDTIIYDKDGNEIANVSGIEKRRIVPLSEIPKQLQDAYISIEDERFYSHNGVDIKRTVASTVRYILNGGSSSAGGGSTITQQLIKNFKDDKDNSGLAGIQRKIREISRAYKIEEMLSKDQILELYLNLIFLGSDVYGVELGSQYYFNKSVTELDLAECAFLAGINNAPNSYNPFGEEDKSERIEKRTKTVLAKMLELEKIDDEQYKEAIAEVEEGLKFSNGSTTSGEAMSYVARAALNQVINQFAEEKDIEVSLAKTMIEGGGYKIYTTQDSSIQAIAEEVYRSGDYVYEGKETDENGELYNKHTQSAIVIIDHKTGNVVGCMGGLGDDVDSNGLNRATQGQRQPGSAIKPIASIAPALEKGIITASTVYDESSTYFGSYHPTNSGKGLITVRKAIEISANTTEVKIMSELGPSNSIEFMRKMGISTLVTASENEETNDENLPLVLGGLTIGISPLEMAGAYATIANGGTYITPTFYTKMEDSNGNVVLEAKQEQTRVISEANAYILQSILTGPVTGAEGTASSAKISGMMTCGKTGTTTSNVDRWFCGFTPYYTAAVWYGYDNEKIQEKIPGGTNYAVRLWANVMKKVHSDLEDASFEKPSNVTTAKVCLDSGKLATDECTRTYTEYFVKGTVPDYCDGHQTVEICKDTGKLATADCPNKETKTYIKRPEKEDTTLWKTNAGDKYDIITETCDVHTKKEVTVPNVVGKTEAEAQKELESLGLKVTVTTKETTEDIGKVLTQSVGEGKKLEQGETITITVGIKKTQTNTTTNTTTNTITTQNTVQSNTTQTNTTTNQNKTTENTTANSTE